MTRKKKVLAGLAGLLILVATTGCDFKVDTPNDYMLITVGSGPFEDKKPKGCVDPGTNNTTITNDKYVMFPVNERDWEAAKGGTSKGADQGRYKSVTKDNVEMYVPMTVRFNLDTVCKVATEFYFDYMRRYDAEFSEDKFDETDQFYSEGWITVLRKLIAVPSDAALDRVVQNYNWRDVWNNPVTKVALEDDLKESLPVLINRNAKGEYFDEFTITIGKPEPVRGDLADAVADEQTEVAKSNSEKAKATADEAKSLAQVKVAEADAKKKRADISAFKDEKSYLIDQCIKAVKEGCIPFPSPIIPGFSAQGAR